MTKPDDHLSIRIDWEIEPGSGISGVSGIKGETTTLGELVNWAKQTRRNLRRDLAEGHRAAELRKRAEELSARTDNVVAMDSVTRQHVRRVEELEATLREIREMASSDVASSDEVVRQILEVTVDIQDRDIA